MSNPTNDTVWYDALAADAGKRPMFHYARYRDDFYAKNLFLCPSARIDEAAGILRPQFSLAMNSKLIQENQLPRLDCTKNTERTALFMDAGVPKEKQLPGQKTYDGRPHVYANRFPARHSGSGNILFMDGHTETLPATQVVTPSGGGYFPQDTVQWTCDPAIHPDL